MNWKLAKQLKVEWTRAGKRDFKRLASYDQAKVEWHIDQFCCLGHGDVKKLGGTANPTEYRLKFKPWRVLFAIENGDTMLILAVVQRKDAYR